MQTKFILIKKEDKITLTSSLYNKFIESNLVFLNKVLEKLNRSDRYHRQWCGELALLFRELVLQAYAAYLHREFGLNKKCLVIDSRQVPRSAKESLEKNIELFRTLSEKEIAEFLVEALPKMAKVQDDLRKLLDIKE